MHALSELLTAATHDTASALEAGGKVQQLASELSEVGRGVGPGSTQSRGGWVGGWAGDTASSKCHTVVCATLTRMQCQLPTTCGGALSCAGPTAAVFRLAASRNVSHTELIFAVGGITAFVAAPDAVQVHALVAALSASVTSLRAQVEAAAGGAGAKEHEQLHVRRAGRSVHQTLPPSLAPCVFACKLTCAALPPLLLGIQ